MGLPEERSLQALAQELFRFHAQERDGLDAHGANTSLLFWLARRRNADEKVIIDETTRWRTPRIDVSCPTFLFFLRRRVL
jgi:hypothetical protein